MSRHFTGYKKQDWIIALAIILVVFLIAQAHITRGMPNFLGGDFSAYITTGTAIAHLIRLFRTKPALNLKRVLLNAAPHIFCSSC